MLGIQRQPSAQAAGARDAICCSWQIGATCARAWTAEKHGGLCLTRPRPTHLPLSIQRTSGGQSDLWRLTTDEQLRDSIVVSISACHAEDPGSIPGRGILRLLWRTGWMDGAQNSKNTFTRGQSFDFSTCHILRRKIKGPLLGPGRPHYCEICFLASLPQFPGNSRNLLILPNSCGVVCCVPFFPRLLQISRKIGRWWRRW